MSARWPEPIRQAPGSLDCALATAAYVCRVLGHEVDIETVRAWVATTRREPAWYGAIVLGLPWSPIHYEGPERELWWLGPDAQPWVRRWLAGGHIAVASVHGGHPTMMHAVALLDGDDEGVTLADPEPDRGIVRWPWSRFLADGPGRGRDPLRVHRVVGWYGPRGTA